MALFNFVYRNHGENPVHMEDYIVYLQLALKDSGHVMNISPFPEAKAVNIMIEFFESDHFTDYYARAARMGMKLILWSTELITGNTFNNIQSKDDSANWLTRRDYWDKRFRNFMRLAETAVAIWGLTPGQVANYATVLPAGQVHLLPYGYVNGYPACAPMPERLKDIDFVFTGLPTLRRQRIQNALEHRGYRVLAFHGILPDFVRANIMARTKVGLGLKQFDDWEYSSLTRNYHYLMTGSYLLTEKYLVPSTVDDYISVADSDRFIDACTQARADPDRDKIAARNLERFRDERPAARMIDALLEQSLG